MNKETLQQEVIELNKIYSQWSRTMMNKNQAQDLVSSIGIFNHTFSVEFPNSTKYYRRNSFAEIYITDAMFELQYYAKSNLKEKDNHFFYDGMRHLERGIENLTRNLQKEIETE